MPHSKTPDDLLGEAHLRERNVADVAAEAARSGSGSGSPVVRVVSVVVAALVVLDIVLRLALPPVELLPLMQIEAGDYTLKVERLREEPAPDVLVLGSSRVRDGVVPEILAERLGEHWGRPVRVFNMGLPNARVEEWRSLVENHLPEPPPAYVIIGLTGTEIVNQGNFQYASRFLWGPADLWRYLRRAGTDGFDVEHIEHWIEGRVAGAWYLFGQRVALRGLLEAWLGDVTGVAPRREVGPLRSVALRRVLDDDGYEPLLDGLSLGQRLRGGRPIHIPPRELVEDDEIVEGAAFESLRETIAGLRDRGSRVVLVEIPSSPFLQARNPVMQGAGRPAKDGAPARPGFRRRVAELAHELDVPFVPFVSREHFVTDDAYLDVNHMNREGARRYTRLMSQELIDARAVDP